MHLPLANVRLDDHVTAEFIQILRRAASRERYEGDEELAESLRWWADHLAEVLGLDVAEHGNSACLSELWLG
jgi:hypothetical protein